MYFYFARFIFCEIAWLTTKFRLLISNSITRMVLWSRILYYHARTVFTVPYISIITILVGKVSCWQIGLIGEKAIVIQGINHIEQQSQLLILIIARLATNPVTHVIWCPPCNKLESNKNYWRKIKIRSLK